MASKVEGQEKETANSIKESMPYVAMSTRL